MGPKQHRVAAYVLIFDDRGRILLTRFQKTGHPKSGYWTLPGGGMEWGEEPADTALRELAEETGLTAMLGPLLGVQSDWIEAAPPDNPHRSLALRLIYDGRDPSGALKQDFEDDDTTIAAAWFDLRDVETLKRVEVVDFALGLRSE